MFIQEFFLEVLDTLIPNFLPVIWHPWGFISLNIKESVIPILLCHSGKGNVIFPYEDIESNCLHPALHNIYEYNPQLHFPLNNHQLVLLTFTFTHSLKLEALS